MKSVRIRKKKSNIAGEWLCVGALDPQDIAVDKSISMLLSHIPGCGGGVFVFITQSKCPISLIQSKL